MSTTSASGVATAASDALASVLRTVRLAPDPLAVWLVCADGVDRLRAPRDTLAVRMPGCARDLPLSGYLKLAVAGATAVRLVAGPCCQAPDEPAALVDARALLAGGEVPTTFTVEPPPRPRGLRRAGPVLAATALPVPRRAVLAPWLLTQLPPRARAERDRLLDALTAIGVPEPSAAPPDERPPAPPREASSDEVAHDDGPSRGFATAGEDHFASAPPPGVLLAATGCTACGVCVRGCPVGALALDDEGGPRVLTQDVSRCIDCGECLRLCPDGALDRARPVTWRDLRERRVVTLATVTGVVTCRRCRQPIPDGVGEEGLCPVCAYRRAHPFGSAVPPGSARR